MLLAFTNKFVGNDRHLICMRLHNILNVKGYFQRVYDGLKLSMIGIYVVLFVVNGVYIDPTHKLLGLILFIGRFCVYR
jgi:hypothetical protein